MSSTLPAISSKMLTGTQPVAPSQQKPLKINMRGLGMAAKCAYRWKRLGDRQNMERGRRGETDLDFGEKKEDFRIFLLLLLLIVWTNL